jgi:hypothetical protein
MYLGSAAAMLVLPAVADAFGSASLLKVVGGLGLAWLALWIVMGQEIPHRWAWRWPGWVDAYGGCICRAVGGQQHH